jgi:hypothetical protein
LTSSVDICFSSISKQSMTLRGSKSQDSNYNGFYGYNVTSTQIVQSKKTLNQKTMSFDPLNNILNCSQYLKK